MSILNTFHADIKAILEQARSKARSAVNAAMVEAYWLIGQRIAQEEQRGQHKTQYGKRFSYANLYNCRQFYLTFPDRSILYTVCRDLSWSHLRLIMRIDSPRAIDYYCNEAREQGSTRSHAPAWERIGVEK